MLTKLLFAMPYHDSEKKQTRVAQFQGEMQDQLGKRRHYSNSWKDGTSKLRPFFYFDLEWSFVLRCGSMLFFIKNLKNKSTCVLT